MFLFVADFLCQGRFFIYDNEKLRQKRIAGSMDLADDVIVLHTCAFL